MEVKRGYNKTEVGVIPEEWEVLTIDEIFQFKQGVQTPVEQQSDVGREGYKRFIRIIDLTDPSVAWRYIADPGQAHHVVPEDLFMVRYGSPGLLGFGHEGVIANNLFRLIPKKKIRTDFYYQYLSNRRADIADISGSSTMPAVNFSTLSSLKLVYPPLLEQRAIATTVSDVDGLLGGLDRLIAKKRDLKQAAMQQLLTGQTRLPGFHGEWKVKRLGDIGEITSAGVDKKIRPDEVPVRLVNYLDVYRKDFIYSKDLNHWVTAPPQQAKRCAVQKGDVFFTPTSETRDDIGISSVAMEDIPDAAYSYHVARLRLREPWDLCFRTYAFKTRAFLDQAETLCDGNGTRYVISQGKFRSMTVQVPPIAEQTAIAEVLTDMDAELAALEQRREKTRALKQAMMQALLTGRTRLV